MMATILRPGARAGLAFALGVALAAGGCAAVAPRAVAVPMPAERARIAVLPFDNLTPEGAAGEVLTLVFFTELGARGDWEPVETGLVLAALESLGVRSTGSLGAAELAAIGDRLGVSWLLVGSVLEHGVVRTPEGELPSVGVTVKLLDAASGRVLWTRMGFRSGDDGETVFGWGREKSPRKLAARLAGELLRELPAADRRGLPGPEAQAVSARKETP